jgi:alkylation response protein AidB-like acyl-CoA dehydrogenase
VFENCRVPEENVFTLGNGDLIISKAAFTWSGPVAAIAAVGVARSAYEYVLKWAKTYTAGSDKPIIHYLRSSVHRLLELDRPRIGDRPRIEIRVRHR